MARPPRRLLRWGPMFVSMTMAAGAGCAGILGLDEVTESGSSSGGEGGPDGTTPGLDGSDDGTVDGSKPDAPKDAPTDTKVDGDAGTDVVTVDSGCNQKIATDFNNAAAGLPPQVTQFVDGTGSTIIYENIGVGGSRAMHVTVPVGSTTAGLTINISSLANDGAKACAITCSVDVKILTRGGSVENRDLVVQESAGAGPFAVIAHSGLFSYFSHGGAGLEAPDLGTIGNGLFTSISIDVSGTVAPYTGRGAVGANTSQKTLTFFPASAIVGLSKASADPAIEAAFDNVLCKAHVP